MSAILTQNNITLETVRVASAENPADAPSRYASTLRVVLSDVAFCRVESLHGTIDRFASWDTTRCALFNCGHGDAHALAVDSFSQSDWASHNNYCQPPARLIPELLHFLLAHPCNATVCVPLLRSALWFLLPLPVYIVFLPATVLSLQM